MVRVQLPEGANVISAMRKLKRRMFVDRAAPMGARTVCVPARTLVSAALDGKREMARVSRYVVSPACTARASVLTPARASLGMKQETTILASHAVLPAVLTEYV